MRSRLMSLLRETPALTFEDLCREMPSVRGPLTYFAPGSREVAYWSGLTAEAIGALTSLRRAGVLRLEPCDAKLYEHGGGGAASWGWGGDAPTWAPSVIVRQTPGSSRH